MVWVWVTWIVVGIIAGALARLIIRGEGPGGCFGDLIIGIIGALIGGWLFNFFGHKGITGINVYSIIVAFVGSLILLFIIRLISPKK
jgi:uncharacterized membrane protein YeaQ/YmgE (transglycosylase-associated protein family)